LPKEKILAIMLHFKLSSPCFHDAVDLYLSLGIFLVVVAHPRVDSPINIHLSQEKRVVRNLRLDSILLGANIFPGSRR
jgi:hypothetical protein